MSSSRVIRLAEDVLSFTLDSAKTYQDALSNYAQKVSTELTELDKLISAVGHEDEAADYIQLSVTIIDAKRPIGPLTSSQLGIVDSPFADESAHRLQYVHLTTPRPLRPKDFDLMEAAIKTQNERLQALQERECGRSTIDVASNLEGLDWNLIAEKVSDSQSYKWTGEECRFRWMSQRHPCINHKEWNNQEIDQLKEILALDKNASKPNDWVDIARQLGTSRIPLDCMRKAIQIQSKPVFKWDQQSEARLLDAIDTYGEGNWSIVARCVSEELTGFQCEEHYGRHLSGRMTKGAWADEEDKRLDAAIAGWGHSWVEVASCMYGRANDQCRDRYLERQRNSAPWTEEEDRAMLNAYEKLGPKWTIIASLIGNGRGDNECRLRTARLQAPKQARKVPQQKGTSDASQINAPSTGWHIFPSTPNSSSAPTGSASGSVTVWDLSTNDTIPRKRKDREGSQTESRDQAKRKRVTKKQKKALDAQMVDADGDAVMTSRPEPRPKPKRLKKKQKGMVDSTSGDGSGEVPPSVGQLCSVGDTSLQKLSSELESVAGPVTHISTLTPITTLEEFTLSSSQAQRVPSQTQTANITTAVIAPRRISQRTASKKATLRLAHTDLDMNLERDEDLSSLTPAPATTPSSNLPIRGRRQGRRKTQEIGEQVEAPSQKLCTSSTNAVATK